jgi:hypothetical protein
MACKPGYEGPLCAVCSEGFVKSLRECKQCSKPSLASVAIVAASTVALLATLALLMRKYRRSIDEQALWSHAKILISFLVTHRIEPFCPYRVALNTCSVCADCVLHGRRTVRRDLA